MAADDLIPILFDTDIGSDIDDAVALSYLLRQPYCELLGITTVSGDTQKRAALADIVCTAGGRTDIPIYAGLQTPLLHGPGQPDVPQYAAVAHLPHKTDYPTDAITFLRDIIYSRPHEITLLAVGPMTNIAALFAAYPETVALLKHIVLMCGVYRKTDAGRQSDGREWNAKVDPIATAIVYKHGTATDFTAVGLDVTLQCTMSAQECRERFNAAGGALGVVGAMAEVWFRHAKTITFHDPLAAAMIFAPDLCELETGRADVDADDTARAGFIEWTADPNGQHKIATTVVVDAFFEEYFGITAG